MTTKIVVRLMAGDRMLGWAVHDARVKGDGCLRAHGAVMIAVRAAGAPDVLSLHWCDINVEVRVPVPGGLTVKAGDTFTGFPDDAPMIRVGDQAAGLPAITVGQPVAVSVPVGAMGSKG